METQTMHVLYLAGGVLIVLLIIFIAVFVFIKEDKSLKSDIKKYALLFNKEGKHFSFMEVDKCSLYRTDNDEFIAYSTYEEIDQFLKFLNEGKYHVTTAKQATNDWNIFIYLKYGGE